MPKQPERIGQNLAPILAQVKAGAPPVEYIPPPNVWDGDVDEVIDLAVQEMGQRMADPLRRADVPDHVLIKFVAEANRSAERRQAALDRVQAEVATKDEIQVIVDSPLPWDKKRTLLEAALSRLDVRRDHLLKLIEGNTDE